MTALFGLAPMRSTRASAAHHRESISACRPDVRCSKPYGDIEVTIYACPQYYCARGGASANLSRLRRRAAGLAVESNNDRI